MKTKKQYIAPATEVVDVEVQLLTAISGGEDMTGTKSITWDNSDGDGTTSASEGW